MDLEVEVFRQTVGRFSRSQTLSITGRLKCSTGSPDQQRSCVPLARPAVPRYLPSPFFLCPLRPRCDPFPGGWNLGAPRPGQSYNPRFPSRERGAIRRDERGNDPVHLSSGEAVLAPLRAGDPPRPALEPP